MLSISGIEIGEKIYDGARSVVYRGLQTTDNRPVILKTLKEEYPTPDEIMRYRREYETTRRLKAKGVPRPFGLQKIDNRLVLITDDIGGRDLKNLLQSNSFTTKQLLTLALRMARTLGRIHGAGLIHGDIKTANFVYNPDSDELHTIDFGSSVAVSGDAVVSHHHNPAGTPAYMSPEQTGRMNRPVDWRTDFYALGVVFYELFTGRLPFETNDVLELMHSHMARLPQTPKDLDDEIPVTISDLIMRLLAKNPEDRYQSAAGLEADLKRCLEQLNDRGRIEPFSLAREDISTRFEPSRTLVGRERELEVLAGSYIQVAKGAKQLVLMSGSAGSGKTALALESGKRVSAQGALFLRGQFAAAGAMVPFSAVVDALQGLVRQLLGAKEKELERWRERIMAAVGNNGQVLLELIPEAAEIIGDPPPAAVLEPAAAGRRLSQVLLDFIRVFSRPEHPLVLFLDAFDRADPASLQLIETMLTDERVDFLLILAVHRNEGVDQTHPIHRSRASLEKRGAAVSSLAVPHLEPAHVVRIAAATLRCDGGRAKPLGEVIHQKTDGNPFFVFEFLNLLHRADLVHFDSSAGRWDWNLEAVKRRRIADSVASLLEEKLNRLEDDQLAVLTNAAILGRRFDLESLVVVGETSRGEVTAALRRTVRIGLIVPLDRGCIDHFWDSDEDNIMDSQCQLALNCRFKFSHDQLHKAAYALIPEAERDARHLRIAALLKAQLPDEPITSPLAVATDGADELSKEASEPGVATTSSVDHQILFQVVDQYRAGLARVTDPDERVALAGLFLEAGKHAKTAALFENALGYFKTGIALLPQDTWQAQYQLTLSLHNEGAEAALLDGDTETMERLIAAVNSHAASAVDRAPTCEVEIQFSTAQNRWSEAADKALEIVNALGFHLRATPGKIPTMMCLFFTKMMIRRKSMDQLADLPPMVDPVKKAAMRILMRANAPLITLYPDLYPAMVSQMMRTTVCHGSGPVTATAYMNYGLLLGSQGKKAEGIKFGQLALRYLDRGAVGGSPIAPRFGFYFAMSHWNSHLRDTLGPVLEIHQQARDEGDAFYTAYSLGYYSVHALLGNRDLAEIETVLAEYEPVVKSVGVDAAYNFMQLYRQTVANLAGESDDPCRLMGEHYNEVEMLALDTEADNRGRDQGLYGNKVLLGLIFGEYERVLKHSQKVQAIMATGPNVGAMGASFYYWDALVHMACYPTAASADREGLLKHADAQRKELEIWARQAPVNYAQKYALINAVRAWVLGDDSAAMAGFDEAIRLARQNDYLCDEGLANEFAARFYLEKERLTMARAYLIEARYAYLRWGAAAKVSHMEQSYPELQAVANGEAATKHTTGIASGGTTTGDVGHILNMASVLKSTQALSSEIVLDKLLAKLLHLMMENAGAQKGFLVMDNEGTLLVEARAELGRQEEVVRQSLPLDRCRDLSRSIVNYVARTREATVLDDAANAGKFTHSPYVRRENPSSILCMPLIAKENLVGVLYLENNLASGVFTPDHLEVLKILSSQAAISLDNARLYDRLSDYSRSLEEIIAALNVAQEVQQNLLPRHLPRLPGIDIAGRSNYCDETGGDYFDFIKLPEDRLGIVVGDVSGHGISAALLMASARGYLRARATLSASPAEIITAVNHLVSIDTAETGQFMTLFYLVVDPATQRVTWVRAGHDPGVLYCPAAETFSELSGAGMVLGADEDWEFREYSREIEPGQILMLTTDGIFEAHNPAGEMFGKERFQEVVRQSAVLEAEGIRKAVIDAVTAFRGEEPQEDDITLVVLKTAV